jgi:AcrR family transcriptional regulator
MLPEQVARHQKTRLELAMVEAVANGGFADTTIDELVGLAGVSKTAFYKHFEDKQDCFLATFEEIVRRASEQVSAAYREPGDLRERLVTALATFMELAVSEPAAVSLVVVDSLTLGSVGVEYRERGTRTFETMVRQSFDHSSSPVEVSDVVVRAIVAGIRAVVYRQLRAGQMARLPGLVEPLVDWALGYEREPDEAAQGAMEAASRPSSRESERRQKEDSVEEGEQKARELPWTEPPNSRRSRAVLDQRSRVLRAAARVVGEGGYSALTVSAISATAGMSNQTFYEHFQNKRVAFFTVIEIIAAEVTDVVSRALLAEEGRPEAVGAGLRALTEYFAERELFARLAFFELPTAGPLALDRADEVMDTFAAFLGPKPGAAMESEILPAIPGGIWAVIQHEIAHGRLETLPELAPEIAWIAVAPFSKSADQSARA